MALFKISGGNNKTALDAKPKEEGHCWYTYGDSKFYIDYKDSSGTVQRQPLNAAVADNLTGKNDLIFYKSDGTQTLKISHDSGNIAGGYLTGTWLQTTATGDKAGKFATIDENGWIYYRTASEVVSDIDALTSTNFTAYTEAEIQNMWDNIS